jgi:hypothetical protein
MAPPREGLEKDVLNAVLDHMAHKAAYLLERLDKEGYTLDLSV